MKLKRTIGLIIAAVAIGAATGCGGGGKPAPLTGALAIVIHWPKLTRLIPSKSNSIVVTLTYDDFRIPGATQTVARPPAPQTTATVTFPSLLPGDVSVGAAAYPAADGTGIVQAVGLVHATITAGKTITTPGLTMASTIAALSVTSKAASLTIGQTAVINVQALDNYAPPNVILINPAKLKYSSDDTGAYTITPNALQTSASITANVAGSHRITVTETESGVVGHITLMVGAPPPLGPSILIGDSGNGRVVGLDAVPATVFSTYTANHTLQNPGSVAFDSLGRIYILDPPYSFTRMDDMTGANLVSSSAGGFAISIAVDSSNRIYYVDTNGFVNRMDDMAGTNLVKFKHNLAFAVSFAVDSTSAAAQGPIYVRDDGNNRIVRYDNMTGANPVFFGSLGSGVNQFSFNSSESPAIAVDAQHRIYVADVGNNRIVRFDDMSGKNWTTFAVPGPAPAFLMVALDHASPQHIYFVKSNPKDGTVYRMNDMTGAGLVHYGTGGTGSGQFQYIAGLAVK